MSPQSSTPNAQTDTEQPMKGVRVRLAFAWAFVGIPLTFGVFETAKKAAALFTG